MWFQLEGHQMNHLVRMSVVMESRSKGRCTDVRSGGLGKYQGRRGKEASGMEQVKGVFTDASLKFSSSPN